MALTKKTAKQKPLKKKPINLALQGGGAHGAFAWGVLDYLLEDGRLDISAITATSAGAMNAAVCAYGHSQGGADGARAKLDEFWHRLSKVKESLGFFETPMLDKLPFFTKAEEFLSFMALETATHAVSPYQFNPMGFNPLRNVLEETVNFADLQKCNDIKLFISATNVRTGKVKVFQTKEVTADAVLASACLPYLHHAVEIDGEHYWDGGYMGNPSLWPLFYEVDVEDLVVVHLNPITREQLPTTSAEITNRINEISFNASLLKEMRAIAFVQKLLDRGWLDDSHKSELANIRFHSIRADTALDDLSLASKYNTDYTFLTELKQRGREMAKTWLATTWPDIGKKSSVDLHEEFLDL